MDLPRRPSSHPPRSPSLDSARGTFREALTALRNLSALVRSRKVGPRAILDLVPDVRNACEPLSRATLEVIDSVEAELDAKAVGGLRDFLADRIGALTLELAAAEGSSMNARQRLRLEQALDKLSCELGACRALLALLESAVYEQTLPIDFTELMLQTYSGPATGGGASSLITARIQGDGRDVPIMQPRTLAALLAGGVELLADRAEDTPQITVAGGPGSWSAEVTLSSDAKGQLLTITGNGLIPPTLECLRAAAARLGTTLSWHPDEPRLRLEGAG